MRVAGGRPLPALEPHVREPWRCGDGAAMCAKCANFAKFRGVGVLAEFRMAEEGSQGAGRGSPAGQNGAAEPAHGSHLPVTVLTNALRCHSQPPFACSGTDSA